MWRIFALTVVVLGLAACDSSNPVAPPPEPQPPGGGGFQPIQGEVTIEFPTLPDALFAGGDELCSTAAFSVGGLKAVASCDVEVRVTDTSGDPGTEVTLSTSLGTLSRDGSPTGSSAIDLQVDSAPCGTNCVFTVSAVLLPGDTPGSAQLVASYKTTVTQITLEIEDPGEPPTADFETEANGRTVIFTDKTTGTVSCRRWEFQQCGSRSDCNPLENPDVRCQNGTCVLQCSDLPSLDRCRELTSGSRKACTADVIDPVYTYLLAGTFPVALEVANPIGESSNKKSFLDVSSARPEASFSSESSDLTVIFTDESTGTVRCRKWEFQDCGATGDCNPGENPGIACVGGRCSVACNDDDGIPACVTLSNGAGACTSAVMDPTFTYTEAGTNVVALTVGNDMGTDVAQKFLDVGSGDLPVSDFDFEVSKELEVFFLENSTGKVDFFDWSFGDGTPNSQAPNPTHTYAAAGDYLVSLTVSNTEGESDSESKVVSVEDVPVARYTFARPNGSTDCKVLFQNRSTGDPTDFQWKDDVDSLDSTNQDPQQEYAGVAEKDSSSPCDPDGTSVCTRNVNVTLTATNDVGDGRCSDRFLLQETFDGGDTKGCTFVRQTGNCAP